MTERCDYCSHDKDKRPGRMAAHEIDGEFYCETCWKQLVGWLEEPDQPAAGEYEVVLSGKGWNK